MSNFVPLDTKVHVDLKLNRQDDFHFCRHFHLSPLVIQEMAAASAHFPICFVKDAETGEFRMVALLGLKPEENLFVRGNRWDTSFVPEYLRYQPFKMVKDNHHSDQGILCVDLHSTRLSDTGERLFEADGSNTVLIEEIGAALVNYSVKEHQTAVFIAALLQAGLIGEKSLSYQDIDGRPVLLNGLYLIQETGLNSLSDDEFLALKHRGYLAPIYAALFSSLRTNDLVLRKRAECN